MRAAIVRATASKSGLLAFCQWFARAEAEWADKPGPEAAFGTVVHEGNAHYIATGEVPSLEDERAARLVAVAAEWVDYFGRDKLSAEVAMAWDPVADVAEVLPVERRRYDKRPGWFYGTADVVAVSRVTKAGYLADWKTGDASGAGPQLRALAVMLARAEGLDSVTVEALELTPAGVRSVCRETLDALDLDAIAGELAEHVAAIPTAEPQPGSHCGEMWCPARATCPAGRAIVAQVIPADALVKHRWSVEIASPEHAAWLLDHARLVEAAAKAVKDAVKAACPAEGWALEDGSVLRESTREMPRFDRERALALLVELGATPEQVDGLTYRVTESAGLRLSKPGAAPKRRRKAA